jgi:hypothetical protein
MNSGLRIAELHEPPCDAATVRAADVPPVLKPVASDMDRRNCVPFPSGSWYWKDPLPFWKAEAGIETFLAVANT